MYGYVVEMWIILDICFLAYYTYVPYIRHHVMHSYIPTYVWCHAYTISNHSHMSITLSMSHISVLPVVAYHNWLLIPTTNLSPKLARNRTNLYRMAKRKDGETYKHNSRTIENIGTQYSPFFQTSPQEYRSKACRYIYHTHTHCVTYTYTTYTHTHIRTYISHFTHTHSTHIHLHTQRNCINWRKG